MIHAGYMRGLARVLAIAAGVGAAGVSRADEVIEVIVQLNSQLQTEQQAVAELEGKVKAVEQHLAPTEKAKKIWEGQVQARAAELERLLPRLDSFAAEEKALNAKIEAWNSRCAGTRPRAVWESCQAPGQALDRENQDLAQREAPVLAEFNEKMQRLQTVAAELGKVNQAYSDQKLGADRLRQDLRVRHERIQAITARLGSSCAGLPTSERAAHCAGLDFEGRGALPAPVLRPGGSEHFGIRGAGEAWREPGAPTRPQAEPSKRESVIGVPVEEFKPKPRLGPAAPPPPP